MRTSTAFEGETPQLILCYYHYRIFSIKCLDGRPGVYLAPLYLRVIIAQINAWGLSSLLKIFLGNLTFARDPAFNRENTVNGIKAVFASRCQFSHWVNWYLHLTFDFNFRPWRNSRTLLIITHCLKFADFFYSLITISCVAKRTSVKPSYASVVPRVKTWACGSR